MERSGFFARHALPRMLEQSFALLDYTVQNKDSAFYGVRDQSQAVAVALLNLAANSIPYSNLLSNQMAEHTGLVVCQHYQDPYSQWVAKAAADRKKFEQKCQARGWDEQRISEALKKMKGLQQAREAADVKYTFGQVDGRLDYYFVRFFNHLTMFCNQEQLLTLIHEGGLINKLKGVEPPDRPTYSHHGPAKTLDRLAEVWNNKAHQTEQEDESRSLELRQQGNTGFKGGELQAALDLYWQAAALNPQDTALMNTISLAALRLGDVKQAIQAAGESLKVDPAVAESWCRLGDAYRAVQRWQLAHLCYSCATQLDPGDEVLQARQANAHSCLSEVWSIEDIPHPMKDLMRGPRVIQWLGLSKAETKKALAKGEGFCDYLTETRGGHSRLIAFLQLKKDIDDARALAVAAGTVRASSLPPSCRALMRPDQLPIGGDTWSISWTDTPLRHNRTGLIRYVLTVMSSSHGYIRSNAMVLGTPSAAAVKRVLLAAMVNPMAGSPERPAHVFVAHRYFPIFHKIADMCSQWGVHAVAETAAEAQQSAQNNDTDWHGYNNTGRYGNEDDTCEAVERPTAPDPNNGHKAAVAV